MIVSKRNGKVDAEIFLQHLREGPDEEKDQIESAINDQFFKLLGLNENIMDTQGIYNLVNTEE